MAFDWGGFTGGIIGTLGAFGVAFYTLRHQNKKEEPSVNKKKYQLSLKFQEKVGETMYELNCREVDIETGQKRCTISGLTVLNINLYHFVLELLPEAIECDSSLHNLFVDITKQLNNLKLNSLSYITDQDYNYDQAACIAYIKEFNRILDSGSTSSQNVIEDIRRQAVLKKEP